MNYGPQETVTIAALLGFEVQPSSDKSDEWLIANRESAVYAPRMEDLPEGEWKDLPEGEWAFHQGMHERAVWVTVPVDSPEASSAIANAEVENRRRQRIEEWRRGGADG